MGKLALLHRGRSVVLPPLALLEPFIERNPHHWYWTDEFFDDGLDRSASFMWAPPAERAARFMVPRLLWQLAHPEAAGRRLLLENVCGLYTCINPSHWVERGRAHDLPARIVLPEGSEARPVLHPGHLLVHIARYREDTVTCGSLRDFEGQPLRTPVTCYACIAVWVAQKQLYEEVK
jgi:hypothetical protein